MRTIIFTAVLRATFFLRHFQRGIRGGGWSPRLRALTLTEFYCNYFNTSRFNQVVGTNKLRTAYETNCLCALAVTRTIAYA